jgi:hypothetical protein
MADSLLDSRSSGRGSTRSRPTWRQIQLQTREAFTHWLDAGRRNADVTKVQTTITNFLIASVRDAAAVERFVEGWKPVLGSGCNEPDTYHQFDNVLAYCHLHFLERYRRFYQVLERLYAAGYMPLKDDRVRILDVGTGPAPCLYALQDFYEQVRSFGAFYRRAELSSVTTELRSVEQSPAMSHFMHHFSEFAYRPGPFSATHSNFLSLDLAELRRESEAASKRADEADWDDPYTPWPFAPEDYKHDLYIFSNFFTTKEFAHTSKDQIRKIFYWLGPGHRVLIMGSSSASYQAIYELIDNLARQARVDTVSGWDDLFHCHYEDFSAERVKANYNSVFDHLMDVNPKLQLPPSVQTHRDIWDQTIPLRGPKSFRARLYNRSRLLRWRTPNRADADASS